MSNSLDTSSASAELRQRISDNGPVSFAEFMSVALYGEPFGYYTQSKPRIGRSGDFITNASVSKLFGKLLAQQLAQAWSALGNPNELHLIEQGAGDGWLAGDILNELANHQSDIFEAIHMHIVEPLEHLAQSQQHHLAGFTNVTWHESLDRLGSLQYAIHYSNELVDAMPVHLIESDGKRWLELFVTYNSAVGCFEFQVGEPTEELLANNTFNKLPSRPQGFRSEISVAAENWITDLCSRIARGYILVIDYGMPREELLTPGRSHGTIRSYSKHRQLGDILDSPGRQDLTAHVDFTMLAEHALTNGWQLAGFTDQHHFLTGAAADLLLEWEKAGAKAEIAAFKTLSHPASMGTSFHFLGLAKGLVDDAQQLSGFQFSRKSDYDALIKAA